MITPTNLSPNSAFPIYELITEEESSCKTEALGVPAVTSGELTDFFSASSGKVHIPASNERRAIAKRLFKEGRFSDHFEEALNISSKLADDLYKNRKWILTCKEMRKRLRKKRLIQNELFEKCFMSFMEVKLQSLSNEPFSPSQNTKMLFGAETSKIQHMFISKQGLFAEGGNNQVFLAVDILKGKIRVLRQLTDPNETEIKNLQKETSIHKELLNDPQTRKKVVKIFAEIHAEIHGSILAFCAEGSLSRIIKRQNLKQTEKKEILLQIADFLQKLHAKEIVFGDLKPENILIKFSKEGRIKVKFTDFGGSHYSNQRSRIITPDYWPPEIYTDSGSSVFSDCWVVGLIMVKMKYNNRPQFIDETIKILCDDKGNLIPNADVKKASALVYPGLAKFIITLNADDPYDALIIKLLQHWPRNRPSAAELHAELANVPLTSF